MGFWSSIKISYEIEETWYDRKTVEHPPSVWDLNKIFKDNDFFNLPFGGEGIPTITITEDYDNKVIITISCKDEGVSEMDVIEWWYYHIWALHATKARLKIVPDWTSSKLVLKYDRDVKTINDVVD